jgi:leader peptidase (prepilin peptidase)/N-methyltransferase
MVPIASFLALRGRCRHCGSRIAPAHLGIELAALAVAVSVALVVNAGPFLWVGCLFGWWLLTLAWIDATTFRLPDILTLPLIVLGLAEAAWLEPHALLGRAAGAIFGYGSLWLLAMLYLRFRGREGLGFVAVPWLAAFGAVLALLWAGILRLRGTKLTATSRLPFGPFLIAAGWGLWLANG